MRFHSWSSLATVSLSMPVSRSRTRAALAVGATPNTGRSHDARSSTARSSMVVLPVPAGPTTTTSRSAPATAAAASACSTSSPARSTVVDGAGSSAWASIAQASTCSSSARIVSLVKCGGDRLQPHRPAIRGPAADVLAGRVEIDAVVDHLVTGLVRGRPPSGVPTSGTRLAGGHRSPAAHRPGSTSTREAES